MYVRGLYWSSNFRWFDTQAHGTYASSLDRGPWPPWSEPQLRDTKRSWSGEAKQLQHQPSLFVAWVIDKQTKSRGL